MWRALLVLVMCMGLPGLLHAQNLTGSINGVVTDSSGAVIPRAIVTIANAETGVIARSTYTDQGGRYSAPALLPGIYNVTVQATGFKAAEVKLVRLDVDAAIPVNLSLRVGSVSSQVTVTANATTPDLEDASTGTQVVGKQITEVPLSSRNFLQFLSLEPGVNAGTGDEPRGNVKISGGNNIINFSVNGQAHTSNGYFLDGADIINHDSSTMLGAYPSVEAMQEVHMLRGNYGAQYGGNGVAIVNLVTKSGTSQFHGDAYFFLRNQNLDANNYFDNLVGIPLNPYRYDDFGGTFGGPVLLPALHNLRKSTFFFLSEESLRNAEEVNQHSTDIPTALQRQGIFSTPVCVQYDAQGKCQQSSTTVTQFSATAQAYLKDVISKIPVPNDPSDPQGIYATSNGILNENQTIVRIDHTFSAKLSGFFRFFNDPYNQLAPNGIGTSTDPIPGLATTTANNGSRNYAGHVTYIPSATWVIEAGASHQGAYDVTAPAGLLAKQNAPDFQPALPFANTSPRISTININGTGYKINGPLERDNTALQAFINVTHVMGRHTLLFGANVEKLGTVYQNFGGTPGNFAFNAPGSKSAQSVFNQSFADFLIGYATSFSQSNRDNRSYLHSDVTEAYVQDNFRVTNTLTLNAGMRYSYYRDTTSYGLPITNFDSAAYDPSKAPTIDSKGSICTTSPCAGGVLPNPNAMQTDGEVTAGIDAPYGRKTIDQPNLTFAPRFAFAWDPYGNGKTAVRGGYGIYYLLPSVWGNIQGEAGGNFPSTLSISSNATSFDAPTGAPATTPQNINATAMNWKEGYLQSFDFDLQQMFPGGVLADVGYIGNLGRHIPIDIDVNQPVPGEYVTAGIAPADGIKSSNDLMLNRIRPYPGWGVISTNEPIGSSHYNGLQTALTKRFRSASEFGLSYTWSRAYAVGGNVASGKIQNIYNLKGDYGYSSFQRNQIFAAQWVYALPFYREQKGFVGHLFGGYELNGVVNLLSGGFSTAKTSGVDPGGIGLLNSGADGQPYPDQVSDPRLGAPRTRQQWFNTSAYVLVPAGQARPGDSRPQNIPQPGIETMTLGLMRNIRIWENLSMQFRAEAFNAFNHTNFNGPQTTVNKSNFGQITGAGQPRTMQLAAKIIF